MTISLGASAVSFGSSSSTPLTITWADIPQDSNNRLRDGEAEAKTTFLDSDNIDSDIRSFAPTYVAKVGESVIYARDLQYLPSLQPESGALSLAQQVLYRLRFHLES
jgi:hypothetical protein